MLAATCQQLDANLMSPGIHCQWPPTAGTSSLSWRADRVPTWQPSRKRAAPAPAGPGFPRAPPSNICRRYGGFTRNQWSLPANGNICIEAQLVV